MTKYQVQITGIPINSATGHHLFRTIAVDTFDQADSMKEDMLSEARKGPFTLNGSILVIPANWAALSFKVVEE